MHCHPSSKKMLTLQQNIIEANGSHCDLPPHPSVVMAVEHVAALRGGSQPHLMRCSDGFYYVVKFANNPQGTKILANELLAHQLASFIGLPIPPCAIVEVRQDLIRLTEQLVVEDHCHKDPCQAGLVFGSRHKALAWDLPFIRLAAPVDNLTDFLGMLVFDRWACNTDRRQVLFHAKRNHARVSMIDNGFCFNGARWNFRDYPGQGLYECRQVYQGAFEIFLFEPWLRRIEERVNLEILKALAKRVPAEWFNWDYNGLAILLSELDLRRSRTRERLNETLNYARQIFRIDTTRAISDLAMHANAI